MKIHVPMQFYLLLGIPTQAAYIMTFAQIFWEM